MATAANCQETLNPRGRVKPENLWKQGCR